MTPVNLTGAAHISFESGIVRAFPNFSNEPTASEAAFRCEQMSEEANILDDQLRVLARVVRKSDGSYEVKPP